MRSSSRVPVFVCFCVWMCPSTLVWSHRKPLWQYLDPTYHQRTSKRWYEGLRNSGTVVEVLQNQDSRYGFDWHQHVTSFDATKRRWVRGAKLSQLLSLPTRKLGLTNSKCIADGSAFDQHEQALAIAIYTGNTHHTDSAIQLYHGLNHDLRQLYYDDYSSVREANFRASRDLFKQQHLGTGPLWNNSCAVDYLDAGMRCFQDRWGGYLYWLLRGFKHVAAHKYQRSLVLYRAITFPERRMFTQNEEFTWHAFSSSARSPFVPLTSFTAAAGNSVLFIIRNAEGVDVSSFSAFPVEGEILILPDASMKVVEFFNWNIDDRNSTLDMFLRQTREKFLRHGELKLAKKRKVSICIVDMIAVLSLQALKLPAPDSSC
eukprot:TRINITY_DN31000_c0_g1_i1.p1 TRINITY_DN31000_c0_g1~~TRINITY_DN31000_c0_g1_i1.p1  ORF type:complete len:373 (+),score=24.12 TRINITY_DN31000_c0_g1_i1:79-1197(+)